MLDSFLTIQDSSSSEFKDRGSTFLGFAFPVDSIADFKRHLQVLKDEHPKAAHHCFAYRMGTDGLVFRVSDDGEPSGTAGRPILGQIDSRKVTNIMIVVVRYFGGTLLGVPGLINAYKTTASLTLDAAKTIERPILINYRLQFDYTMMNDVMQVLKQNQCVLYKNEVMLFCSIDAGVPKKLEKKVREKLNELRGVEFAQYE